MVQEITQGNTQYRIDFSGAHSKEAELRQFLTLSVAPGKAENNRPGKSWYLKGKFKGPGMGKQ